MFNLTLVVIPSWSVKNKASGGGGGGGGLLIRHDQTKVMHQPALYFDYY